MCLLPPIVASLVAVGCLVYLTACRDWHWYAALPASAVTWFCAAVGLTFLTSDEDNRVQVALHCTCVLLLAGFVFLTGLCRWHWIAAALSSVMTGVVLCTCIKRHGLYIGHEEPKRTTVNGKTTT